MTPVPTQSPLERQASESASQPALFSLEEAEAAGLEAASTAGVFSGERLAKQDPGKYRSIVVALAEGMGIRQIARAFRVSVNTVAAIRTRERLTIDTDKQELAARLRLGARLASERIVEEIGEFKRESLPIVLGILVDKMQLLAGEATSIIERRDGAGAGSFAEILEAAKQREGRVIDAEVVETGLGGEENRQKAAPGPGLPSALGAGLPSALGAGLPSALGAGLPSALGAGLVPSVPGWMTRPLAEGLEGLRPAMIGGPIVGAGDSESLDGSNVGGLELRRGSSGGSAPGVGCPVDTGSGEGDRARPEGPASTCGEGAGGGSAGRQGQQS